jgi:hypothetical protein
MSNRQRLFLVVMATAILFTMGPGACDETGKVVPGDGKVGDAVIEGYNGIRDGAGAIMDAVEDTGDGLEVETHESPIPAIVDAITDAVGE